MTATVLARLGQAALLLLLASAAGFLLVRLSPGDPGVLIYGPDAAPADIAQLRERWGLDAPLHIQYLHWLENLLRGDFGQSYTDGRPVLSVIAERVPATLQLTISALLVAVLGGGALGLLSAPRRQGALDRGIRFLTTALYSTPSFWLGIVAIYVFSSILGWFPAGGSRDLAAGGGTTDLLRHMVLPVLVLSARDLARFARVTRAAVLEVMAEDYVRTATAKGLSPRVVSTRHLLRNALLPVIALVGVAIPGLLGGAVVVETVFSWPGMGRLAVESALQRNYPVILGEVVIVAGLALAGSTLADLASAVADPRIRKGGGR